MAGIASDRDGQEGRKVVAHTFVTLDGYMVGPDEDMSWASQDFDRDMARDIREAMSEKAGIFLFGRVTYAIFHSYWPHAVPYSEGEELRPAEGREDPALIHALNAFPKLVVSRTLQRADWGQTRVIGEGFEDEIRALKREPGKDISIQGSASIVQALTRADLIDEYLLYLHPVLLGAGKPLFPASARRHDLRLVRSKAYANGVLALTYRRRSAFLESATRPA